MFPRPCLFVCSTGAEAGAGGRLVVPLFLPIPQRDGLLPTLGDSICSPFVSSSTPSIKPAIRVARGVKTPSFEPDMGDLAIVGVGKEAVREKRGFFFLSVDLPPKNEKRETGLEAADPQKPPPEGLGL
mmetsp:Transcript_33955/g.73346  ORF Transcript_33955/g.73346 Transcript_33955/m.73346 type:complete len:128 (-) Transcript_33955:845-1228(-)